MATVDIRPYPRRHVIVTVPVLVGIGILLARLALRLAGADGGGVVIGWVLGDEGSQFVLHVDHALMTARFAVLSYASSFDNLCQEIKFLQGTFLNPSQSYTVQYPDGTFLVIRQN